MFGTRLSRGYPWSGGLFRDMERLRDEMNRIVHQANSPGEYPAMNVWLNADGALVTAEIPGVKPGDIDISVAGGALTIRGSREAAPESLGKPYRAERPSGGFSRTIDLPFAIDGGKVAARYERGVLEVTLPRTEADKPRKITVKAE